MLTSCQQAQACTMTGRVKESRVSAGITTYITPEHYRLRHERHPKGVAHKDAPGTTLGTVRLTLALTESVQEAQSRLQVITMYCTRLHSPAADMHTARWTESRAVVWTIKSVQSRARLFPNASAASCIRPRSAHLAGAAEYATLLWVCPAQAPDRPLHET